MQNIEENPYLQSRMLWNDVYGDVESRLQKAQRLNMVLSGLIGLSLILITVVALQTQTVSVPFIVRGDDVITVNETLDAKDKTLQARLAPYFAKNFLLAARAVSHDKEVNQRHVAQAFAMTSGVATAALKRFFQQNSPISLANTQTRRIHMTSILRESAHSLHVRWTEASFEAKTGQPLGKTYHLAEITYQYGKPSTDRHILQSNPMGFYITSLVWSDDLTHEGN